MDTAMSRSGEEQNAQPNVFTPAKLGPVILRNRIIKAATFEAATPDALVTDDLINYHRLPAAGGVGMTTVAYCAVSPGGRTDGWQIWMRPEAVPGLRRLTETVHAEGAAISAQIGHAGPVANARTNKAKALAPVRFFNPHVDAVRQEGQPRRHRRGDAGPTPTRHGWPSSPGSTPSRSTSATTIWPVRS